ncbi:phosphoenolpyruvate--protein phosphotransferase [Paucibacter sediminis]|uniref:phosphoenolpyruvate--protein phosphotransferase n=1 Tax=Paucibacter sediminis TaxID=3019553 RepID=A0AA95NEA0_9BURK|nr:phosphoenolpyruvate--protein phosphotransferase [Paucibacter sp. S2-9]WIT11252.1 phosphoenolpyruvate--protein phosphotransferase [Paucibacter sp. S2-9]
MSEALSLLAPFDGIAMPLQAVADPVFAGLVLGDGLAIEPLSATLLAPCDGVLSHLARSAHALTLTAPNGAELLLHIGIDTVQLQGQGFNALVRQGDAVRRGQPLIVVDLDWVARRAPSLQTMLVLTGGGFQIAGRASGRLRAGRDQFLQLAPARPTANAAGLVSPAAAALRARAQVLHRNGLHARPSALVQAAARAFAAEVQLEFRGRAANARSMTALMGLAVGELDEVLVCARGADAEAALQAVVQALQSCSGAAPVSAPPAPQPAPAGPDDGAGDGDGGPGLRGVCAAPGLALGQVLRLDRQVAEVPQQGLGLETEFARLASALKQTREEIGAAMAEAAERQANEERDIYGAHLALADDPELIAATEQAVLRGDSAGHAFRQAIGAQCELLGGLGNALLAERVNDLQDLERRLLAALGHRAAGQPSLGPASILVADDLAPSDLTGLPRALLAGLATVHGGATSHVAILARAMGIPALVAMGPALLGLRNGQQVLLDADRGRLCAEPSAAQLSAAQAQLAAQAAQRAEMLRSADRPAQTLDGQHIEVAANIANEADAREALRCGADGVGLLRTEFLFIDRNEMPDAAEQARAYQAVIDAMQGRPAIIRTMDVGGDKSLPYLSLPSEDNPALGLRGIRSGLAQPELLDAQLRGLLAVRPLASLRILIPMVAEVGEVLRVRERIEALAEEMGLAERPQLGVMIEVPSAALLADQLARHVDFFSIGTNDLSQYTLAMDRCHAGLAARLDPMHPALLRLIAMTVEGASQHGKWVGLCGGMASDLEAVPLLLGLGVSELSVSPPLVPGVKARLRTLSRVQCRADVQALLRLESAEAVRATARARWPMEAQ